MKPTQSQVHPGHPDPIWLWAFKSKNTIWTCFGGPWVERHSGKRPNMAEGHWVKSCNGRQSPKRSFWPQFLFFVASFRVEFFWLEYRPVGSSFYCLHSPLPFPHFLPKPFTQVCISARSETFCSSGSPTLCYFVNWPNNKCKSCHVFNALASSPLELTLWREWVRQSPWFGVPPTPWNWQERYIRPLNLCIGFCCPQLSFELCELVWNTNWLGSQVLNFWRTVKASSRHLSHNRFTPSSRWYLSWPMQWDRSIWLTLLTLCYTIQHASEMMT